MLYLLIDVLPSWNKKKTLKTWLWILVNLDDIYLFSSKYTDHKVTVKRNENENEFISQCHMFKTYKLIPLITSTTNCIRPVLAMINYKFIWITIFKVTLYSASTKSLYHLFFKECLPLQYVISFNFFSIVWRNKCIAQFPFSFVLFFLYWICIINVYSLILIVCIV